MRTAEIIAFALLIVATALAAHTKTWPIAALAAGLAVELIPAVFELTN